LILGDRDLLYYIKRKLIVIEPFDPSIVRENGIDLRLGRQIARMKNPGKPFDVLNPPKDYDKYYVIEEGDSFIINPYEHVLLTTLEYIKLPEDIMAFVNLRSTYARLGIYIPPCLHPETIIMDPLNGPVQALDACNVIEAEPSKGIIGIGSLKFFKNYNGLMVQVKTSISKISVTPNHKFVKFDPDVVMVNVPAIDLSKGDMIAITRKLFFENTTEQYVEPYPELRVKVSSTLISKIKSAIERLNLTRTLDITDLPSEITFLKLAEILNVIHGNIHDHVNEIFFYSNEVQEYVPLNEVYRPIDEDIAYIIGCIVGSGYIEKSHIYIKCKDKFKVEELIKPLEKTFPRLSRGCKIIKRENEQYIILPEILSKVFIHNFSEGLLNDRERSVPRKIMICRENVIASFIAGLFDINGDLNDTSLYIQVSNEKMMHQLQILLLRLGIMTKISRKEHCYQVVILRRSDVERFKNTVGKYILKRIILNSKSELLDFIPLDRMTKIILTRMFQHDRILKSKLANYVKRGRIPYEYVKLVIDKLIEHQPPKYEQVLENIMKLAIWFWDTVEEVKTFNYSGKIIDWQTNSHYYIAGVYLTHNTIVDAGFEGNLTIELIGSAFPVRLYAGERFIHLVFAKLTSPVEKPYKGKYQRQRGVTLPKFP